MKQLFIVLAGFVLLIVGFILWNILKPYFTGNINYGTNSDPVAVEKYKSDCAKRGGTLNECGSSCPPRNICPTVCEFICEL